MTWRQDASAGGAREIPHGGRRPRRRRALAAALVAALAAWAIAMALTGHRDGERPSGEADERAVGGARGPRSDRGAPAGAGAPGRARDPLDAIPGRGLALGLTEPNPALIWTTAARPSVPAPFERWRDAVADTRPALYRLMVSWREVQSAAGAPVDLDIPQSGCMRDRGPCAPWAGVREQLAALASRQREGGWEALVVVADTPEWAAAPPSGCEPADAEARARAPRPEALDDYRAVVRALLATAEQEKARLRYWSAWNEPNHPYFLARQRERCESPEPGGVQAAADYSALVGALDAELASAPGTRRVLGELAAIAPGSRAGTDPASFIAALPRDVVCASDVWSQHAYAGGRDPVAETIRALDAHRCERRHRVWITETGAGLPSASLSAGAVSLARPRACRELHERLTGWWADDRVDVAAQYTWREDDLFRVGLVRTDLSAAWPTLSAWRAWSARRSPGDAPPAAPCPRS